MVCSSVLQCVGRTPLVEIGKYAAKRNLSAKILCKPEYFNPFGSVKDRIALAMIEDAERSGKLKAGGTVVEPTSGNTGIALAAVCGVKGYRVVLVMPDSMSVERRKQMRAYGAELVLTEGAKGMRGAIEKANALAAEWGAFVPSQFTNPANPQAHYDTTGPEIWEDTCGNVDIFVAGVGTGGTVTGAGTYLRSRKKDIRIVAAEPADSPVLSGGCAGAHKLQGIGAGFVPDVLDTSVYDEVITVSDADAYAVARALAREEGIAAGISSGAALFAATRLAERKEYTGKTIVTLLPDGGDRYYSTPLYAE